MKMSISLIMIIALLAGCRPTEPYSAEFYELYTFSANSSDTVRICPLYMKDPLDTLIKDTAVILPFTEFRIALYDKREHPTEPTVFYDSLLPFSKISHCKVFTSSSYDFIVLGSYIEFEFQRKQGDTAVYTYFTHSKE